MSIVARNSVITHFSTTRDPTSADFIFTVQDNTPAIPKKGDFWENISTNNLFVCTGVDPGVSATWSLKPSLSEGTFTPTLMFSDQSTGIAYAANGRQGLYTRIGSVVYVNIFIRLTSKGSSQGDATVTGLPFPARSGISPKGLNVILAFGGDVESLPDMKGRIDAGSSVIQLVDVFKNPIVGIFNATDFEFRNNTILQIDGFYYI